MKDSLNVLPLLLVGTGVILFSFSDVVFKINFIRYTLVGFSCIWGPV